MSFNSDFAKNSYFNFIVCTICQEYQHFQMTKRQKHISILDYFQFFAMKKKIKLMYTYILKNT